MSHIAKQSHYFRCPVFKLFCNSLRAPQTKKFGDPCPRPCCSIFCCNQWNESGSRITVNWKPFEKLWWSNTTTNAVV